MSFREKSFGAFGRKGQVSMFVIVALVIVVGIVVFFVVRSSVGSESIPAELAPVFEFYQSCIEREARSAVQLAAGQGGRVDVGEYLPGSEYAPFSSHLNFFGSPVPYWFYVSGNGIVRENVPSESEVEEGIADYVREGLEFCDFESFYAQGYDVELGEREVSVNLNSGSVEVVVDSDLGVGRGEDFARRSEHRVEIVSKLGKFFELGREIYAKQKDEAFLERYSLDVLYLYAPVDGVEIQCAPEIWATQGIINDLKDGFESNIAKLKLDGNYYELGEDGEYFVLDKNVDEAVNFFYSKEWPTKVELVGEGAGEEVLVAEPVGTQQGLGVMGFCYVPYHYVYDVSFPVMVQVYDGEELFQFPVVVVIDNNVAREADLPEGFAEETDYDVCQFKEKEIEVNIFDVNLGRVDANLSYECFNQKCRLGESRNGVYRGVAPACVNGYLHLRAEGYADKKQVVSTNRESSVDVLVEREHSVDVELLMNGNVFDDTAIVSFTRDDGVSTSAALPDFDEVKLSEGNYEVAVYAYGNSSIVIPATTKYECVDVPREGLLGLFGGMEEKCFDIDIPETKIDYALIGGGATGTYVLESELERGGLRLSVSGLSRPNSLEELQQNFELFDTRRVNLEFYDV